MTEFTPGIPEDVFSDIRSRQDEQKKAEVRVLDTLDDVTFFSWGYTSPLKVTVNGKAEHRQLRIKSVGVGAVIEEYQHKMPTPPATMKTHKADSDVARALNKRHPIVVWEVNEADPQFLKDKQKHETEASQMILLHGLNYDLKDESGQVLISGKNPQEPSTIHNAPAALARLNRMGFSSEHFGQIVRAVRELTAEVEKQEDLE